MRMENKIRTEPKSIIIDGDLHNRFKIFCKSKSLKIGGIVEELIRQYLNDFKDNIKNN